MPRRAAHEVLHHERTFGVMEDAAARCDWAEVKVRRLSSAAVAILGFGPSGRRPYGSFRPWATLSGSPRARQETQLERVTYLSGPQAVHDAAEEANYQINALPLTEATEMPSVWGSSHG
ncbi:hypothetical protein KO516_09840 [Citreicella sp. C3M06]|uniref:hypothetical protein n=1 Tax=Citreicella sp. C3M06 TaxID=2841564 RepID=UPI001C09DDA6|nr:hypothetical protein [Citreicella sp. C3M06]MBU2961112.1 hypothetical protein [Citreicella sp. C3M06]